MIADPPAPAADKADPATASDIPDPPKATEPEGDKPHMIPKARLDDEISKRRTVEGEVKAARDALLCSVPEHVRALAPKTGSISDLVAWIDAAKKAGVVSGPTVPTTDQGRPAVTPRDQDLSTMPVHARLSAGYGR